VAKMTKEEKKKYQSPDALKRLIPKGKFRLDCGHHVTLNHNLGSNIAIQNGKKLTIICSHCSY